MITEAFNPQFPALTPNKELNLIGAVTRYFGSYTAGFEDSTVNTYIRDYNERVFPVINPGKPIGEYDEEEITKLLSIIQMANGYDDVTIASRYQHLLSDPFEAYFKDAGNDNPLWGSSFKIKNADESILFRIPRSLTLEQEQKAAEYLLVPTTDNGALLGLAIMLCSGTRNNEAAGFNFSDFSKIIEDSDYFMLRISRTSMINSNIRKAGGKTYNAPRDLPLIQRLVDCIKARKEYICSKVDFPYTDKHGVVFNSVDNFPIACRGTEYSVPCSSGDLSREGKILMRDVLKMREQDVSGISYVLLHDEQEIGIKDPTTYLLRRNFATRLYCLGFPIEWCQYYMGHVIEDNSLKRSDFTEEEILCEIAERLSAHPLNAKRNTCRIVLQEPKRYYVSIENKEINDPITLTIDSDDAAADIFSGRSSSELPVEIDVSGFFG